MEKLRGALVSLAILASVGCTTAVPVECPADFVLTTDGTDCEPMQAQMPDSPDAGPVTLGLACENLACDDDNECTSDGCADDTCTSEPVDDGMACTFQEGSGLCEAGRCVVDCAIEDCRAVYPCTERGLRDALNDGGEVVIACDGPQTVTLTDGMLVTDKDVSLDGLGNLTVEGGDAGRVFRFNAPATAELVGLSITGGKDGGLSTSSGSEETGPGASVTLRDCNVYGNTAENGGGLINNGGDFPASLTLIDTEVTNNHATYRGGGITNGGLLTVSNSTVSGNTAANAGGGLWNTGTSATAIIERSAFDNNTAMTSGGGGIWTSGLAVIDDTSVSGNAAAKEGGGIFIYTAGELRAQNITVTANTATDGGGINNVAGRVTLDRSTVVRNDVGVGRGGGIHNDTDGFLDVTDSVVSENLGRSGAGIFTDAATMTFVRSTLSDNVGAWGAGIRVYNHGPSTYDATFINSTLSGNVADTGGGAVASRQDTTMLLVHVTISNNIAPTGSAVYQDRASTSDVAHSVIQGGCFTDEISPFASLGHNRLLDSATEACPIDNGVSDQVLTSEEMNLGDLALGGGLTPTHLPNPGSLLIDAIPADECWIDLDIDQSGEPRGGLSPCDVGSVEVHADE